MVIIMQSRRGFLRILTMRILVMERILTMKKILANGPGDPYSGQRFTIINLYQLD